MELIRGIFLALISVVLLLVISAVSQELPKVTVGTDSEGSKPMQELSDFNKTIVLPVVSSPMHYSPPKVRFECRAGYPIEWIYNYNQVSQTEIKQT